MGVPENGGFIRETPTKMDDLGVSLFQETSIYLNLCWPHSHLYCLHGDLWLDFVLHASIPLPRMIIPQTYTRRVVTLISKSPYSVRLSHL